MSICQNFFSFFLVVCFVNSACIPTFSVTSLHSFKMDCQLFLIVFKSSRRLERFLTLTWIVLCHACKTVLISFIAVRIFSQIDATKKHSKDSMYIFILFRSA